MRVIGLVKEEISIRPTAMQCPHLGPSLLALRYSKNGFFGRCFLANESRSFFRASALRKSGCPRPDQGVIFKGPNYCRFRHGEWAEI